jgi:hypothetical protein
MDLSSQQKPKENNNEKEKYYCLRYIRYFTIAFFIFCFYFRKQVMKRSWLYISIYLLFIAIIKYYNPQCVMTRWEITGDALKNLYNYI